MPEAIDHEPTTDAALAFNNLCAQVSVLRQSVDAVPDKLAKIVPPDRYEQLLALGKGLDRIIKQLDTIQQYPALNMTPAEQGRSIAQAGSEMLREAVQDLHQTARAADRERDNLAQTIGKARTKEDQRLWLMRLGGAGLALGLFLCPFVLRALPNWFNSHVAAFVIGGDRWSAGQQLLEAGNPTAWSQLLADTNLVKANREKVAACRAAAVKTKQEQSCAIAVAP